MSPKRLSSRRFALPALLAGLVLFSAAAAQAGSNPVLVTDSGSSENSSQRHTVVVSTIGYWAIVNIGKPAIVYSSDGINWGNETPIFPSSDWPNILGNAASYYVKKSSQLYVVASPNYLPSQVGSDSGGNFLLAKATLN